MYFDAFIRNHISIRLWERALDTYSVAQLLNIWKSLNEMTAIYDELAIEVAESLGFTYNSSEVDKVMKYIREDLKNAENYDKVVSSYLY